jgi:hypothetical protein
MNLALTLTAMLRFFWRLGSVVDIRATGECCGGLLSGESRCLSRHIGEDDSSRESRAV